MRNIIKKSKQIQNEFEVKNKESECLKSNLKISIHNIIIIYYYKL